MAKWIVALIVFFPLSLHQLDYRNRFSAGLSFHLRRASPAYAALEDANEPFTQHNGAPIASEISQLKAGTVRIHKSTVDVPALRIALNPVKIKQAFQTRPALQSDMDLRTETPGTGLLPIEERKRILAQYFRQQDWSSPSVAQKAQQLIQAELKTNPPNQEARVIVGSVTKTPIIVAKPDADLSGLIHGTVHSPIQATAPASSYAVNDTPTPTAPAFRQPPVVLPDQPKPASDSPSLSVSSMPPSGDPQVVKGVLEIRDGLAFMGSETYFTLHRVKDGAVLEAGRIWISEARFEIYVKEPHGQLVAELHARDGSTLGRGILDLDSDAVEPLRIELAPVTSGASARVVSGYSEGTRPILVKNAAVSLEQGAMPQALNSDGVAADPERSHHSTYVVRAQAADHWPTLVAGVEGTQQEVRIYPESLVKSLLDLTTPGPQRTAAGRFGIVWGRILKEGKPVAGVSVELAGDYAPVYFNQIFLPDPSKTSTDVNGAFAFMMVRPGVQAIRIRYKDKVYPAQVFPSDMHHVSYVELRLESNRSVSVAVEDAFDVQKRMSAHVRFVGVDDQVDVNDLDRINFPGGPDIMMMEADGGSDYELSRIQVLKNQAHVTIPMIRRDWLQTLLDIKQISLIPGRGTVVGFVTDQPFKVSFPGYLSEVPQLVYFDRQGQIADGDGAPAGGGFVLFNAPLGLQTLEVKPLASSQVFTQTFVAEPDFVHVFKYSFGESY